MSNGVKVMDLSFSIMNFLTQPGWDTEDIWITQRKIYILSLMLIRILTSYLVLILLLQKVKRNSKKSGSSYAVWLLKSWTKMTLHTLIWQSPKWLTSLISEESGNITEKQFSEATTSMLLRLGKFHKMMLMPLRSL